MKKPLLETSEDKISQFAVADAGMTFYPKDSVLMVTRSGILQHTFPVALTGAPVTVNQDIKVLRPTQGISPKFSFYMLKSYGSQILSECSKDGTTVQSIDSEKLVAFSFPLPPLAEQIRIVQKLDELLAQVDNLKARIDAIPTLLKRFRQSVLSVAISGRLSEGWRRKNAATAQWTEENIKGQVHSERSALGFKAIKVNLSKITPQVDTPKHWVWLKLSEIALKITDGAHNTPKTGDRGFPYLTAKDLTSGYLDFSERKFISEKEHRELYKKCKPSRGDLLVVNIGAGTGNNALVNTDSEFSFKNVAIIKRSSLLEPKYLKAFFDSRKVSIFNEQTQGGAQPFLSLNMLGNIDFVLPPLEEQAEIVQRLEELFAFADQLEAKVASAKSRIDLLTQSILAKAFRGELVPQDPNDEPACVLLERIKAQRAAAPKPKRSRKASA